MNITLCTRQYFSTFRKFSLCDTARHKRYYSSCKSSKSGRSVSGCCSRTITKGWRGDKYRVKSSCHSKTKEL